MQSFLFLIIVFVSCNQQKTIVKTCESKYLNKHIKKEVSDRYNRPEYKKKRLEFINEIGMCYLEDGFDSLQIRIEYSSLEKIQIVSISHSQDEWSAVLSNITLDHKIANATSLKREDRSLETRSGWNKMESFLTVSGIFDMRDSYGLENYYISTGGESIHVEIATKDLYKEYSFPDLYGNIDSNANAKKMDEIIKKIENEFSFKFGG